MPGMGTSDLQDLCYALRRLPMIGTVLHVGAHPDDEDTGLLVYVSRKLAGRAVYWSATRGEGGQNIVNSYTDQALGLYRTWESLAAQEIDGGERLFGPFVDYGFSKKASDAFANWDHRDVVKEIVRAVRQVRPQVIVSRWAGLPQDGHGHHQAIGEATLEAFEIAGDPGSFPELLDDGLSPWQPLKLYRSGSGLQHLMDGGRGAGRASQQGTTSDREDILRINTGEFDPCDGQTLQERAWQSVNCHQTQGMGFIPSPGEFYYDFFLLKALVPASAANTGIFGGLDPTITGLADPATMASAAPEPVLSQLDRATGLGDILRRVRHLVDQAIAAYGPFDPSPAAGPLLEAVALLKDLEDNLNAIEGNLATALWWILRRKVRESEAAITRCLGLRLHSVCTRRKLTPGESLWLSARLWNHANVPIDGIEFSLRAPDDWSVVAMEDLGGQDAQKGETARYEVFAGNDASLSCPYWLEQPRHRNRYQWPSAGPAQEPLSSPPLEAECRVSIGGSSITLRQPVLHRHSFPGGYRELPPAVVPPISLHPESDKRFLLSTGEEQRLEFRVIARCNDDEWPAEGHLLMHLPQGWHSSPSNMKVNLSQGGGAQTCAFAVRVPSETPEGHYRLGYTIRCRGRDYGVVLTPVRQPAPGLAASDSEATCIREEFLLSPATVTVHVIEAAVPRERHYAYVEGAKEELPHALAFAGIDFQRLTDYDMAHSPLDQFDAIVIGPNAYIARNPLRENAFRFLEYVEKGGTLIVQYQRYEYEQSGLAPYRLRYSRPHDRVTDETAPVTILEPDNALFRFPNAIGPRDFDGWVHDRGMYFPGQWDSSYTAYLSCADAGEEPKLGGMLGCKLGRGNYLYTGYSFYRQIPAGVLGAFRLFFNILALGYEESGP